MGLKTKIANKREDRDRIRKNYRRQKSLDLSRRDGETKDEFERRKRKHHARERKLKSKLARIVARIKRLVRRLKSRGPKIVVSAGSPHWGGCEDILRREVLPVAAKWGIAPTSGKRSETYGNPDSDHYTGNVWASARDFATANNYAFGEAIGDALGVPYNGYGSDYQSFYIRRAGRTFRVQIICQTHGTGPHTHVGLRLA